MSEAYQSPRGIYDSSHSVEVRIGEHAFRVVGSPLDEHFMRAFDKWIALVRALTGVESTEQQKEVDALTGRLKQNNDALQNVVTGTIQAGKLTELPDPQNKKKV